MDEETEHAAIVEVIEAETAAFFARDFDRWSDCWLHDDASGRLVALPGGHIDRHVGWEGAAAVITRVMERFPTPNPDGAEGIRRENLVVRIRGDMAWVTFDQYGDDKGDAFDSIGLSHQVRILERHDGRWRIAFIVSGETSFGYFSFPVLLVDGSATVLWMNEPARSGLVDHPSLQVIGGRLRGRRRADSERLDAAIAEIRALTPLDVRQSASGSAATRRTVPVVMEQPETGTTEICWVSWQDNVAMVTFNDEETEAKRLAAAGTAYALSPAQVRLVSLVVTGLDLRQAADRIGVTVNTARTQLQRVFNKTGARSQSALVKTLLSVDPPSA